jgi:hypothetical protein
MCEKQTSVARLENSPGVRAIRGAEDIGKDVWGRRPDAQLTSDFVRVVGRLSYLSLASYWRSKRRQILQWPLGGYFSEDVLIMTCFSR